MIFQIICKKKMESGALHCSLSYAQSTSSIVRTLRPPSTIKSPFLSLIQNFKFLFSGIKPEDQMFAERTGEGRTSLATWCWRQSTKRMFSITTSKEKSQIQNNNKGSAGFDMRKCTIQCLLCGIRSIQKRICET